MKFTLMKLAIENFAGMKKEEFNFSGEDAVIYGANGSGKTTTAVALQWLFFGKGLDGKTINEVPLDENNNELYEMIPTVTAELMVDGKPLLIKKSSKPVMTNNQMTGAKEYSKSRKTEQYLNEVPLPITKFKQEIAKLVDEKVFKLVTNPQAFNELPWKERRMMLFEVCGETSDEDIINADDELKPLAELLADKSLDDLKKITEDKLKKTNESIKDIPVRINEAEKSKVDIPDIEENRLQELEQENSEYEQEIIDIKNGSEEMKLRSQITELNNEMTRIQRNHSGEKQDKINQLKSKISFEESNALNFNTQIERADKEIAEQVKQRSLKLEEHKKVKDEIQQLEHETFQFDESNDTCPCCGQNLPEVQKETAKQKALESFNQNKSLKLERLNEQLNAIVQQGKAFKPTIEAIESAKTKIQERYEESQKVLNAYKQQLEKMDVEQSDVTKTDKYQEILKQVNELNKQHSEIAKSNQQKVEEIELKIESNKREISFLQEALADKKANERINSRITELREEEEKLVAIKESLNYHLYLISQFNQAKVKTIEESINKKFNMARFKLFDELKNGNIDETCITTVDGVEYDKGLNKAAKINVGLDIINTLSIHFNVYAPIFIDNAESVTDILKTESQQVQLVVSKNDETLRMELV